MASRKSDSQLPVPRARRISAERHNFGLSTLTSGLRRNGATKSAPPNRNTTGSSLPMSTKIFPQIRSKSPLRISMPSKSQNHTSPSASKKKLPSPSLSPDSNRDSSPLMRFLNSASPKLRHHNKNDSQNSNGKITRQKSDSDLLMDWQRGNPSKGSSRIPTPGKVSVNDLAKEFESSIASQSKNSVASGTPKKLTLGRSISAGKQVSFSTNYSLGGSSTLRTGSGRALPTRGSLTRERSSELLGEEGEEVLLSPPPKKKINVLDKYAPIEPVDYEEVIIKKKTAITNDPLRLMLTFPHDDVSSSTQPRKNRTTRTSVPETGSDEAQNLFVKECINAYTSDWKMIDNKYAEYSGEYSDLKKWNEQKALTHPELKFEIDETDEDSKLDDQLINNVQKQGFMYKTPFGNKNDQLQFMRTYKRRYFYLKQLADKSYLLSYHKDEKSRTAKGTISLAELTSVQKQTKTRKFGMELVMSDRSSYNVAAESELEMDDWYAAFNKVIEFQNQLSNMDKVSIASIDDREIPDAGEDMYSGLSESKHPELTRYGRENERTNAQKRKENRQNLFLTYTRMHQRSDKSPSEKSYKPYEEKFGVRFVVEPKVLRFRLSACIGANGEVDESGDGKKAINMEPFFVTLALYDAKHSKKLSEDFHVYLNDEIIRQQLRLDSDIPNGSSSSSSSSSWTPDLGNLNENWLKYPTRGLFSVMQPHSEVYLVVKVEKVLQGSIAACAEPYIKTGDIAKTCQKIYKQSKVCCARMGQYRMPFCWAARRVFKENTKELALRAEFTQLYRHDSSKLSEVDLIKYLQDINRNPEKLSKLTEIPGTLVVNVEPLTRMLSNCLSTSLVPIMPWPEPPNGPPSLEVQEMHLSDGSSAYPFVSYTNNLYVYPLSLKYDSQKQYAKARNIAIQVELRDSDDEGAGPLKCIYGRPGGPAFVSSMTTAVLHHQQCPDFNNEIKIALPVHLHNRHHLLFRFYHVSCEVGKSTIKKREIVDSFVGYAWIPILKEDRVNVGSALGVSVSSTLPPGYLSNQVLGMGKLAGPEIKWVDGGKNLLKLNLQLVSTIYTKDQHVHNFFKQCQDWDGSPTNSLELIKFIKAMHAVEETTLINFLPVILNQLFHILPIAAVEEVQLNIVRLVIHIVATVHDKGRDDTLHSYVMYVFETQKETEQRKTVHEELMKCVASSLRPSNDPIVIKHLMKHLWFFFKILVKCMAQYLIANDSLKLARHKRFSANFETTLRNLVQVLMPHIIQKHKEQPQEAKNANYHLADFIKHCFTYMDRGFVFRIINSYLDNFNHGDPKLLVEMKWEFLRVVCSHEHFVSLNLPLQKTSQKQYKASALSKKKSKAKESKTKAKPVSSPASRISLIPVAYSGLKKYDSNIPSVLVTEPVEESRDPSDDEHLKVLRVSLCSSKNAIKDLQYDYALTEEFCQNHFLVGILLREVGATLHEGPDVRQMGISVVRNLLAKHSTDDRYSTKQHKARISALYLPFVSIILENAPRLNIRDVPSTPVIGQHLNGDASMAEITTGLPDGPQHERHGSMSSSKSRSLNRDSTVLDAIAGRDQSNIMAAPSGSRHYSLSNINVLNVSSDSPALRRMSSSGLNNNGVEKKSRSQSEKSKYRLSWSLPGTPNLPSKLDRNHSNSSNSLSSTATNGSVAPFPDNHKDDSLKGSLRNKSVVMFDRLAETEIKDLLICLLTIVKDVNEEVMLGWWAQASEDDTLQFFDLMMTCLFHFRYIGKKQIISARPFTRKLHKSCFAGHSYTTLREKSSWNEEKSKTLPAARQRPLVTRSVAAIDMSSSLSLPLSDTEANQRAILEANMSHEVGLIVLDILGQYLMNFKNQLDANDGDNPLMMKVKEIFITILQFGQSELLYKYTFASLRALVNKFQAAMFKGSSTLVGDLCVEVLKCCNSRFPSTRNESCALLYLLMRSNFEFTGRKEFVRVHLQVIIAVSKLISDADSARFQESLAIVNNYANNDKGMQNSHFPSQVRDLTKKIRTVLMATAQMKEHENDPEMYVDLQYSLARSYSSTPELRRTWLESMAETHNKHGNYSEAAFCYIHIAAILAEYLKRKGVYPKGCSVFKTISANVEEDEKGVKDDGGMQDVQYTEEHFVEQLEKIAGALDKAERFELIGEVYKLAIPYYEQQRDFTGLAAAYGHVHQAYQTVLKVMMSQKRWLGNYYRVAFFGPMYFGSDDGKQYIYKEPKVTGLVDISQRLFTLCESKFGGGNVELIRDSVKVDQSKLNEKIAYIQVTFVKPYFDEKDLESRKTEFERSNNINRFVFETPYTKAGKARGSVEQQCMRKTILTTSHTFPYVKKRIKVMYEHHQELSPIQVAIDEMNTRVKELHQVTTCISPDLKGLQLKLQGSVSVQVNAGPTAYAAAFLGKNQEKHWSSQHVWELKQVFKNFIVACSECLERNSQLIKSDQYEYHDKMKGNFEEMVAALSELLGENILDELPTLKTKSASQVFSNISDSWAV
ncbi:dedicator of cytokinesis protein 11-like isoform X8 [Anneissia japonica]|uniref:dedicator of cytokinesis protein 11-like isoform X8 n=1 Tax=Anneissia japonica TaxID=1529436 RepID=UPI00142570DC|nr:dedicator of cytokinesis protein 11-like isoform X8 [Anneissia japonica]